MHRVWGPVPLPAGSNLDLFIEVAQGEALGDNGVFIIRQDQMRQRGHAPGELCLIKTTPLALWVQRLLSRRSRRAVTVALANKLARIAWAVMAKGEDFRLDAAASA